MNGFPKVAFPLPDVPKHLCHERVESKNGKSNGHHFPKALVPDMIAKVDVNPYENWLTVFHGLASEFPGDDEVYQWAKDRAVAGYGGQRSPGDDKLEHDAFYKESRSGRKQTIGSVIRLAKLGDWKPPNAGTDANLSSIVAVFENDPDFLDVHFDEFDQRIYVGNPPRELTDHDALETCLRIQREKNISKAAPDTVSKAISIVAMRNRRNKAQEWLKEMKWDGTPRIGTVFIKYFAADDSEYTRKASSNFLISLVARILSPGCKVDHVVVLEGKQGFRKSMALAAIGGDWFAEQSEGVKSKDFFVNLQGKFLIEIGEMQSFTKNEIERVKQVITAQFDRYRDPYGRLATDHPRQCVFVGTTNRDDWQKDETGGRRFWPIKCPGMIDVDGIKRDRDQLFAEAVHRFRDADTWWEMPVDETLQQQADRHEPPVWAERIEWYINYDPYDPGEMKLRKDGPLLVITVSEVLKETLKKEIGHWTKPDEMRVASALTYLKWTKRRIRTDGGRAWTWYSPEYKEPKTEKKEQE